MGQVVEQLDILIQKWIYKQGWSDLRDIQKQAIPVILDAKSDVVISAATAAGKTEAAFLPAYSKSISDEESISIIYLSPLKALINDQYRRLESLSDVTGIPVTPWHGDVSQSKKKKLRQKPRGILLITPESIESLLIRDPGWVKASFTNVRYIIIDEYHAFIGTERGCHLQSLMHRIEQLTARTEDPIPRIALSATLGDMPKVQAYLRPNHLLPSTLLESKASQASLKLQVRGYLNKETEQVDEQTPTAEELIVNDLFRTLRGDSHLVFANSRQRTEWYAAVLSDMSEENHVLNEFFPHHGSLSKELRHDVESRLQKESLPTTAVCTMTLELGIDIGKVKSIVQLCAPHSVSSLRQRMGRSGRRDGEASILKMFITEKEITPDSHLSDCLRLELLQSIAMIRLLVQDKWYEPPDISQYHFSTLLHQILAVIAQWGGVRADQLFHLLVKTGPFSNTNQNEFMALLKEMGKRELITQLGSGELTLANKGESIVDHYSFYSVFFTPEEYRLDVEGKTIGTLPIDSPIIPGQRIVFGGRRWVVDGLDTGRKVIFLKPSKGGKPPRFGGSGMDVHDIVRKEMLKIYRSGDHRIQTDAGPVEFLDSKANELFQEGLFFFNRSGLNKTYFLESGNILYFIPWAGDRVTNTLAACLQSKNIRASNFAGIIDIENESVDNVLKALGEIVLDDIDETRLAGGVPNKILNKYDHLLSEDLLNLEFGRKAFDVPATKEWLKQHIILS